MGSALSRKGRLTRMRAYIPLYIMLLPALVYVMINKVHYAYAQPDQTDDPQDPRQLWSTNKL